MVAYLFFYSKSGPIASRSKSLIGHNSRYENDHFLTFAQMFETPFFTHYIITFSNCQPDKTCAVGIHENSAVKVRTSDYFSLSSVYT